MKVKKSQILFLGDSTVYGYPYTPYESWVYYIESILQPRECVNLGCNGAILEDMYTNLLTYIDTYPEVNIREVFIMSGLNEVFMDLSLPEIDTMLYNIQKLCQKYSIVLYCGLSIAIYQDITNEQYKRWENIRMRISIWAQKFDIPIIDFNILKQQDDYSDFLHPSLKGYSKMSEHFRSNWKNICRTF